MAVDVAATCASLHAQYAALIAQQASLPVVSVSEGGRSISAGGADLQNRLDWIKREAAALGCPIGEMGEPFCVISGAKATR